MNTLPQEKPPKGVTLEELPAFVPRMVMTPQLHTVVREVLRQWQHRNQFAGLMKFGIRPLDRMLCFGPPGNGKTMACQWICQHLKIPMYRIRCEQMRQSYLGATTRTLGEIVEFLNRLPGPALCLFDEVESIFVDRKRAADACDREIASTLTVFFQALDRWRSPCLLVMCTNLVEQLDQALLSRIDLKLEFVGPTREQAMEVLEYWRELLCEHGADDWGPRLVEWIETNGPPESFRDLQQTISRAARDWVASRIPGNGQATE